MTIHMAIPLCLEREKIGIIDAEKDIYINGDPRISLEERRKIRIHASALQLKDRPYILPVVYMGYNSSINAVNERVIDAVQSFSHPNTLFAMEKLGYNLEFYRDRNFDEKKQVVLNLGESFGEVTLEFKPQKMIYFRIYELLITYEANYYRNTMSEYWKRKPEEFRFRIERGDYSLGDSRLSKFMTTEQRSLEEVLESSMLRERLKKVEQNEK